MRRRRKSDVVLIKRERIITGSCSFFIYKQEVSVLILVERFDDDGEEGKRWRTTRRANRHFVGTRMHWRRLLKLFVLYANIGCRRRRHRCRQG